MRNINFRQYFLFEYIISSSVGLGQNVFIKIAALANLRATHNKSSREKKLK